MSTPFPRRGQAPWGADLKAYIDAGDTAVVEQANAAVANSTTIAAHTASIAVLDATAINVLHPRYGVTGSGDHTAALQAVLTANPGKTIVFPAGTYNITTLNVTGANTHLVLMAGAVLNKTTAFTDGIVVTGADVTISGPGVIQCPAEWNSVNTAWTYAVIHGKADGLVVDGVRFVNIPKVGIGFRDINNVQVTNCQINGNIPSSYYTGTETGHFGICYDPPTTSPNGNVVVTGNIIRTCVEGFIEGNFGSGALTQGIVVSGNTFELCRDHGVYIISAVGANVTGNSFSRCRVPVAVTGDFHVVNGNTMYTDTTDVLADVTGISLRNANGCVASHNTIKGVSQASGTVISVTRLTSSGPTNDNIIEGNTIICTGAPGRAIALTASSITTELSGNIIRGNIIKSPVVANFGVISATGLTTMRGTHNQIVGNTITYINATNSYGIHLLYQDHAIVRGNTIRWELDAASATVIDGVRMVDSSDCVITDNRQVVTAAWGANLNVRGHNESGTSDYNYIANNHYLFDTTKMTAASAIVAAGANSIRDNNRTARAWPSHETGAGAPSAARPNGSTYSRTDGAAGSTYYVREAGAWVAK